MALFESYERRIDKINGVLAQYGISSVEECREICQAKGFDPYEIVKGIQPICFENACWAYTVGAAIALKKGVKNAAEAAEAIGIGLQAFCIDGSVAEDRKVGLGHGNLGAMLLRDETKCFAFLAGHESFAAAEGAIGIARSANKARKSPLRVILNGLGKDAAQIISRINGFTYVQTQFDEFIAGDQVVLIQSNPGDIALGHLQITGTLFSGGEHGTHLAAQALAQVLQRGADGQAALGESGLGTAVDDLQEQLPHGGVDGVAHQVGVQSLQQGLTDENLGSHGGGVGHAGAADGLHQSFLNHTLLDIQGQLAGTLLRSTPADAVGETTDILNFLDLNPLALFGNWSGAVVGTLGHGAHMLYFCTINHGKFSFLSKDFLSLDFLRDLRIYYIL